MLLRVAVKFCSKHCKPRQHNEQHSSRRPQVLNFNSRLRRCVQCGCCSLRRVADPRISLGRVLALDVRLRSPVCFAFLVVALRALFPPTPPMLCLWALCAVIWTFVLALWFYFLLPEVPSSARCTQTSASCGVHAPELGLPREDFHRRRVEVRALELGSTTLNRVLFRLRYLKLMPRSLLKASCHKVS